MTPRFETPADALKFAIEISGGTTRLAALLGFQRPNAVSNWIERGVPAERCLDIDRVTGGRVRCEDLRPDVDWAYLRSTPATPAPSADKAAA